MNSDTDPLAEQYSRMETEQLIILYQQNTLTEIALPILENELQSRELNLSELKNTKFSTPQEIDKKVLKQRSISGAKRILWRLFYRLVVPAIIIYTIYFVSIALDWFNS